VQGSKIGIECYAPRDVECHHCARVAASSATHLAKCLACRHSHLSTRSQTDRHRSHQSSSRHLYYGSKASSPCAPTLPSAWPAATATSAPEARLTGSCPVGRCGPGRESNVARGRSHAMHR
jgi:hypothetical protein